MVTLEGLYIKSPNEIFARHLLATRRQQPGESLDEFLQSLRKLSKDCNLKAVSAEQYREELLRDSFINGLYSSLIRQRLLENKTLSLQTAYDQANSLDLAQKNAESYSMSGGVAHAAAIACKHTVVDSELSTSVDQTQSQPPPLAAVIQKKYCYFCGNQYHQRRNCPAREVTCNNCGVKGHFAKVCLYKKRQHSAGTTATPYYPTICAMGMLAIFPPGLSHVAVTVTINGHELTALIDSRSSDSFISEDSVKQLGLEIQPSSRTISMALTTMNTSITGCCTITLTLGDNVYNGIRLSVLKDLCSDIILGHNFQKLHKSLTIDMGGTKPDLIISNTSPCALSTATIDNISLFTNLLPGCKPIATKSRRFSFDEEDFIQGEIDRLLSGGIIEPSTSPWRAQIVVVKNGTQSVKKRLCIDYSQTINLYTELDAYPLPRIDTMINKLAQYKVFSTYDLKNAYHQIPISQAERKYTAFEAGGQLYQFCRIPFGVTNGVAVFQRLMDKIIKEEELKDTFPYLDDITVAGRTQEEHDSNVKAFLEVVQRRHLTLNHSKSVLSALSITVL